MPQSNLLFLLKNPRTSEKLRALKEEIQIQASEVQKATSLGVHNSFLSYG